jgi:hypothetical protein
MKHGNRRRRSCAENKRELGVEEESRGGTLKGQSPHTNERERQVVHLKAALPVYYIYGGSACSANTQPMTSSEGRGARVWRGAVQSAHESRGTMHDEGNTI